MKAFAQKVFSRMPAGHRVNMLFQRAIGGVPLSDTRLEESSQLASHHLTAIARHTREGPATVKFFEFGAGFDLHMPLLLRSLGACDQHVVDLRPLARADLVRNIADRIRANGDGYGTVDPLPEWHDEAMMTYLESLGITYRAPADARATGLPPGSIGAITSTNTLEHIPPSDIAEIYRECRRLIAPSGILSFQIDYSDHYSHFDSSISPYNFLRFDDRQWRRFNSSLHYQNRLRHTDHLALICDAGFEILECHTTTGTAAERHALEVLPLAPAFSGRPLDELAILDSRVVLKPSATAL